MVYSAILNSFSGIRWFSLTIAKPILVEQIAHRIFKDRYSRFRELTISTMAGILVLPFLDPSLRTPTALTFLAYKIIMFFFRFDQLDFLIVVDRMYDFNSVQKIVKNCVVDLHMSFQQIETFLRRNNCYTYLIARKRNETHTNYLRFTLFGDPSEKTYYLFVSLRNQSAAMAELLEESETYEANFDKLNDTGFIQIADNIPLHAQFTGGTFMFTPAQLAQVINQPPAPVPKLAVEIPYPSVEDVD